MSYITLLQNNWCGGELAPTAWGRVDSQSYTISAARIENFLPGSFLRKRPGTIVRAHTKDNARARLFPLLHSDGTRYLLEFTPNFIRARDMQGAPVGTDINAPYGATDLAGIKWAVNKGIAWFWHTLYPTRTVQKGSPNFTSATPTFSGNRLFNAAGDYAGGGAFLQGRLLQLGAVNRPSEVCLSRARDAAAGTDRYLDYTVDAGNDGVISPSDAIVIEKSDPNALRLKWAVGQKRLVVASDVAISQDNGQLMTPAAFDLQTVKRSGPADIQGALADSLVVYVGAGATLRGLVYSTEAGGYQDVNLSKQSDHILLPGVIAFAVQSTPETIIWIIRSDGTLASCSLDFDAGIAAFARHPMDGFIEDIAVSESSSEGDTIWLEVLHGSARTLESFTLPNIHGLELEDEHYIDSGVVYSGSSTSTIPGLEHLEGKTVAVLGDGKIQAPVVVSGGSAHLKKAVTKAHVGLPIVSVMETLRPQQLPSNGTSQSKKYRIEEVTARMYRTLGGEASVAGSAKPFLYIKAGEYKYGEPVPLFTGDKGPVTVGGQLSADATIKFTHSEPAPCNLLALIYRVAVEEV